MGINQNGTLQGKHCLVTGATSGIGKAIALGIAQQGARVVIVARDAARGARAVADIRAESGNSQVDCLIADLSSQAAIRKLADAYQAKYSRLHVLVNDAVVLKQKRETTPNGLELMFATNHLAYFLLTNLLLDILKASARIPAAKESSGTEGSSIWNVTAPSTTRLNFEDLQGEQKFSALQQFGASKMANLLFTFALARRLEGTGVVVNAYHPGLVRSNLMQDAPPLMRLISAPMYLTASPPGRAVEGLVQLAATNAGGANGQFFHYSKAITAPPYALDTMVQDQLWQVSAQLTGLKD